MKLPRPSLRYGLITRVLVVGLAWTSLGQAFDDSVDGIEWPASEASLNGQIEVRGTVGSAGPLFRSYRLEYGSGRAPDTWTPIGPERDHSVERDVLGLWDTRGLPAGDYMLRLTVIGEVGQPRESRVPLSLADEPADLIVTIEPLPPTATPGPTRTAAPTRTPTPTTTPTPTASPTAMPIPSPTPTAAPEPGAGTTFRCPMLYYHEVPGQAGFAAQVAAFLQAGYLPVTLGRVVDGLEGRQEPPPNCLVMTFDDGLASQISGALPVLLRYSTPASFFVMPSFHDGVHRYMTPDDFRTLRDTGFEIGSHTLNHASLPGLLRYNFGSFQAELTQSKALLEHELGQPVDTLAYPNGAWDRATAEEVQRAGYRAAVTTVAGGWQRPEELYWLRRFRADPWESPATVLARLRG